MFKAMLSLRANMSLAILAIEYVAAHTHSRHIVLDIGDWTYKHGEVPW